MPEDVKKTQDKKKIDPKEQRKPRNSRSQGSKPERKAERDEVSKPVTKVTVPQKPPVYEEPGPEFYKNLKRETEDILKITQAENSKYKKKEIQSNWSKYEMPIETYEEIEEHDVGADYEKLIQAPLSIGGHFQFKHEKSWDVNTGPSLYDKYFDINMDNLSLAMSTIPFFERNDIEESLFSENDMLSMNNRAMKYKQQYYNDKSYATSETEAQDKILDSLSNNKVDEIDDTLALEKVTDEISENNKDKTVDNDDIKLDFRILTKTEFYPSPEHSHSNLIEEKNFLEIKPSNLPETDIEAKQYVPENSIEVKIEEKETIENNVNVSTQNVKSIEKSSNQPIKDGIEVSSTKTESKKPEDNMVETEKCPVIESPEDLEKWLDDFLDG